MLYATKDSVVRRFHETIQIGKKVTLMWQVTVYWLLLVMWQCLRRSEQHVELMNDEVCDTYIYGVILGCNEKLQ